MPTSSRRKISYHEIFLGRQEPLDTEGSNHNELLPTCNKFCFLNARERRVGPPRREGHSLKVEGDYQRGQKRSTKKKDPSHLDGISSDEALMEELIYPHFLCLRCCVPLRLDADSLINFAASLIAPALWT